MNEYCVEFSYMKNGRRVHEKDFSCDWRASDAADGVREFYKDLEGLRIERVWFNTGTAWEEREFDY